MNTPTDTNTQAARSLMGFSSYPEAYGALAGYIDAISREIGEYEDGESHPERTVDRIADIVARARQTIKSFRHQQ